MFNLELHEFLSMLISYIVMVCVLEVVLHREKKRNIEYIIGELRDSGISELQLEKERRFLQDMGRFDVQVMVITLKRNA